MPDFFTLPTQMKDFVTTMHCRNYPLIIDALGVCDRAPMLLLAIKTQTANFANREAIRETWGRSGRIKSRSGRQRLVRRVFLLGKSKDLHVEEKLHLESEKYGDIIQWEFMDTFFNLTLKDVLFWNWFSRRCPHARFIFKGDDDIFMRTPALLDYLLAEEANRSFSDGSRKPNKMETFVVGDVINNAAPMRSSGTKYYIPESFFKGLYPSYPGGGGVVYSGSLAHRLLEVSQRVHLFPIDDVYLGMCLQRLGVYIIHHPAFLTFDFPKDEPKEPCANHTILMVHKRSPAEMFQLWTETSTPSPKCRNATLRVQTKVEYRGEKPVLNRFLLSQFSFLLNSWKLMSWSFVWTAIVLNHFNFNIFFELWWNRRSFPYCDVKSAFYWKIKLYTNKIIKHMHESFTLRSITCI